jgi:hypothetical protein
MQKITELRPCAQGHLHRKMVVRLVHTCPHSSRASTGPADRSFDLSFFRRSRVPSHLMVPRKKLSTTNAVCTLKRVRLAFTQADRSISSKLNPLASPVPHSHPLRPDYQLWSDTRVYLQLPGYVLCHCHRQRDTPGTCSMRSTAVYPW